MGEAQPQQTPQPASDMASDASDASLIRSFMVDRSHVLLVLLLRLGDGGGGEVDLVLGALGDARHAVVLPLGEAGQPVGLEPGQRLLPAVPEVDHGLVLQVRFRGADVKPPVHRQHGHRERVELDLRDSIGRFVD